MRIRPGLDAALLSAGSPRILVVEDDAVLGHTLTMLLEDRYQVYLAPTGKGALTLLSENPNLDLVLLDHNLPDISGIEVLRNIKATRASLPVIFITGCGSEALAVKAFTGGVKDYLRKPFSFSDLTAKIEFCLSLTAVRSQDRAKRMLAQPPTTLGPAADTGHEKFYKIQKAVKYIEDNFTSAITLEAAARRACISPYHFCRVFKEVMGVPFKHYLVGLRIERAKQILRQESLKISEIGHHVGYDEPAHFVKIFKKRTGCTPTEYRRSQSACERETVASS